MIIIGGLTRLTDSGLSITKWQLFSGFFPPMSHDEWILYFDLYKKIPEYVRLVPGAIKQNPKFNGMDLKRTLLDLR